MEQRFLASLIVLTIYFFISCRASQFDPYETLGVRRHSSADEIRKTYKKLAREWHPDKNKAPDANEKFTEINRAYEILGDEKKKDQYDRFGKVEDSPNSPQGNAQFFRTPFGNFQFFSEGFGGPDSNTNRITERFLQSRVLPESFTKPYFFFATTDFCFNCLRVQPIWNQFTKDLDILELGYGVVDVDYNGNVVSRLRIPRIPCIGVVVNGRSIIFETEEYSAKTLRTFARKLIPDDLIITVTDNSIDEFLGGYKDNKVRVMFFGTQGLPTMRFLISLYQLQSIAKATYFDLNAVTSNTFIDRYDVETDQETLLIFHEDPSFPVYTSSRKEFQTSDFLSAIGSHKYLKLPRIASPAIFDELCPSNPGRTGNKYCVILTFASSKFDSVEVSAFRDFISEVDVPTTTKFAYAFTDTQHSMCTTLQRPAGDFKIVIISRKENMDVEYSWLDWCAGETCRKPLEGILGRLAVSQYRFTDRNMKRYDIRDELQPGLFYRILKRLRDWWDHFTYTYFDGDHSLTIITIMSTTLCIGIISFLVSVLNSQETKTASSASSSASSSSTNTSSSKRGDGKFTIYDLRSHNYDRLIKDAEPGHRLLVLFVDAENKQNYIKRFADLMMPFKRTPYLLFAFLYIDKYINWYQRLLSLTVGHKEQLKDIQYQLCAGTVLAINGYRKYYNIYHPKTLNIRSKQSGDGAFVGLEDSSDSDLEGSDGEIQGINGYQQEIDGNMLLAQNRLLDGLSHWVERLFDGSLLKCQVDRWPMFPVDEVTRTEQKKDQ